MSNIFQPKNVGLVSKKFEQNILEIFDDCTDCWVYPELIISSSKSNCKVKR